MPSMIKTCACGRKGIMLKRTGKCIHCSKGGAGKPARNNTASSGSATRQRIKKPADAWSDFEGTRKSRAAEDKGSAPQDASYGGRQRVKKAKKGIVGRAEDSDGMFKRNQARDAGNTAEAAARIAKRSIPPVQARGHGLYVGAKKLASVSDVAIGVDRQRWVLLLLPGPRHGHPMREGSNPQWVQELSVGPEKLRNRGKTKRRNGPHGAVAKRPKAKRSARKTSSPRMRGRDVFFGGKWHRPGDPQYKANLQLAREAAAGVETRNRGGAKFLSDEIAFEKAMAGIGKANQSMRAMAKLLVDGGVPRGNRARYDSAREAAIKHFDAASLWGRKVANKNLLRKLNDARNSFWRSMDGLINMHSRFYRGKARASARNHGHGGTGEIATAKPSAVTRNASKSALRQLSNPRSKAWD